MREINDLKRVRAPGIEPSVAGAWFRSSAAYLFHGAARNGAAGDEEDRCRLVAHRVTAEAIAATRLGAITVDDLVAGGVDEEAANRIFRRAAEERREALDTELYGVLVKSLDGSGLPRTSPPVGDLADDVSGSWIERLVAQPRAGATAPGHARIVLEPVESCAEHCLVTAVYAVMLAPSFGAEPDAAFATGLAHHIHNARLPDAGFAGEALIGDELDGLVSTLRDAVLAQMDNAAAERVAPWLAEIDSVDTPLARTFHTADTIDRVLQMDYFAQCNRFTLDTALVDMELVHAGPIQEFQFAQLANAGLAGT